MILVPGQRYEVTEKVPREARHVGIVALFRPPAPQPLAHDVLQR